MPDNKMPDNEQQPSLESTAPKMFTETQVQSMIRDRLTNQGKENEKLQTEKNTLQQKHDALLAQQNQPLVTSDDATQQQAPSGLTNEDLQNALQKQQETNDLNRSVTAHDNFVKKAMLDPDFASANKHAVDNNLTIPEGVQLHLSSTLGHDSAKAIFKKLLTDEGFNNKARLAMHDGAYDNWLSNVLLQNSPQSDGVEPVADLGNPINNSSSSNDDDDLSAYLAND